MKKYVRNHILLKAWAKFARENGGCIQCQYPWYDGVCDCKFVKENKDLYAEIERLAFKLSEEGWEL